jgi:AcrR family transcriptional regulator
MGAAMNLVDDATTLGLRERKKLRTRAMLIRAAVQLCLKQGYEQTTVDQIAAAADVSPRTFSRYFATKDAVYMALLEGVVNAIGVELARIPHEVPVLWALKEAHIAALSRVPSGGVNGLTSDGIALMLQVINSTHELKTAAGEFQSPVITALLAERMGVEPDSRSLRLVNTVWSAIIVTGCGDLVMSSDGLELGPELMAKRINESFDEFISLTARVGSG